MVILTEGRKEFLAWAKNRDPEVTKKLLNDFLATRNKYPAPRNNMDWWIKNKRPIDLSVYMQTFKSNTQKAKEERIEGSEKIYDGDRWVAVRCNTYNAMKYYGSGTKWCISGRYPGHEGDSKGKYYFDSYLQSNYSSYTVVIDRKAPDGDNKWCVCIKKGDPNECDIWNAKDDTVGSIPEVPNIPGLPPLSAFTITDEGELIGCRHYGSEMIIPEGVLKIHQKLFMDKSRLYELTLPEGLVEIGAGVCANTGLSFFSVPSTVEKIGRGVCLSCDGLRKVILNSSAEVPDLAFAYCDDLKEVHVKKEGTVFGEKAFLESGSAKNPVKIFVEHGNPEELTEWAKGKDNVYIINGNTMEIIGGSNE